MVEIGAGSWSFHECDKCADSKLALCESDQVRDAHLEIGGRDKAGPENRHHVSHLHLAVAHQFRTKPEALDEHAHCNKLVEAGGDRPHAMNPPCNVLQFARDRKKCRLFM